jgi:hypothetical protein
VGKGPAVSDGVVVHPPVPGLVGSRSSPQAPIAGNTRVPNPNFFKNSFRSIEYDFDDALNNVIMQSTIQWIAIIDLNGH